MKWKWLLSIAFGLSFLLFGALQIDFSTPPPGCAFCNPRVLNSQTVYLGDLASVVLTHKPIVPGHLLVIPNRHVERFEEMTEGEIKEIGELIKRIKSVREGAEYLLLEKNGRGAGQSVLHVHVHVLPKPANMGTWSFVFRILTRALFKPSTPEELDSMRVDLRLDQVNDLN